MYQIDEQGCLIDEHGQYILDNDGNKFFFTEEHLENLRNRNVLQEFYD